MIQILINFVWNWLSTFKDKAIILIQIIAIQPTEVGKFLTYAQDALICYS